MAVTDSEHDYELTRAIGGRALDYLKEFGRCPSPQNYALLYTHTAGYDKALSNALRSAVSDNGGLSRDTAKRLHEKFLSPANHVAPVQAALACEAGNALKLIDRVSDSADDMWFSLQVAKVQLAESEASSGSAIERIVERLIKASQDVARQTYVLEQQLAESKEQLDELRDVLTVVRARQDGDSLTGLPGRKQFYRMLDTALDAPQMGERLFSVVVLDLDDFRSYNEVHGRQVSDQILRLVANIVTDRIGGNDSAARYGGDTFGILLPDRPLEEAVGVAERIRDAVSAQRFVRKASRRNLGRVTVSAGVVAKRPGDDRAALLQRAADCLCAAKQAGRNRVVGATERAPAASVEQVRSQA